MITNPDVERFLRAHAGGFSLPEVEAYAHANYIPILKPETAQLLQFLCVTLNPSRILEIGTAIGYSTTLLSRYGAVTTVEKDAERAAYAREVLAQYAPEGNVHLIEDDAETVVRMLPDQHYDLIFLDANKSYYNRYLPDCKRLLKEGGVLVADNVLFDGMVAQPGIPPYAKRALTMNLREFLDAITHDEELTTTILPLGDGVSLSVKKKKVR
ncbi:MAG: O-methyltransferase [Ruminococcaceae bacterium]|nr:O-methyltransferase [Oscillospiraceae bacterium]